jgi:predicted DNA-binding ribbon-helix-helix protein
VGSHVVREMPGIATARPGDDPFRDYLQRIAEEFACPPADALEKLIETAGIESEIAVTLRASCADILRHVSAHPLPPSITLDTTGIER